MAVEKPHGDMSNFEVYREARGHENPDAAEYEELAADLVAPQVDHHPTDGRTQRGMIFSTGSGDERTFWSLVDFDQGTNRHFARYARVTPALRSGFVEILCTEVDERATRVDVSYELTALTSAGRISLQAYEPERFARMIEGWRSLIESKLSALASARIR